MDGNLQPADNVELKTAFRKPTADAANRKYRRHSPVSGSPPNGSPQRERSASPKVSADESGRVYENRSRRSDNGREVERNSDRNRYGRGSDSYKHSDRHYSRSSHGYSRHDDYIRHDKHGDVDERSHQKLSSRSCWESSGGTHSDHGRSRDHLRNKDKFYRDKNDGSMYKSKDKDRETSFPEHNKYKDTDSSFDKAASGRRHVHPEDMERERRMMEKDGNEDKKDSHRSSGDYRGDRILQHEDSKGHRSDSSSWRDDGKHHAKESYKSEVQEIGSQNLIKEGKKKYDDVETNRSKARYTREPVENSGEKYGSENQESPSKKQKISLEKDIGSRKRVSKFSSVAEPEVKESSSYQPEEGKMTTGQGQVNVPEAANDFNAAKFAAMKAAELVNKNLVGGVGSGLMTADQKKKLLWGNKKATAAVESGHSWDSAMFSDRERQEKFNKLMGVKGDQNKPENKGGSDPLQAEKQKELQLDLEKQYTAGLRRRDGRTVGLGL